MTGQIHWLPRLTSRPFAWACTVTGYLHTSVKEAACPGAVEGIIVSRDHVPWVAWDALHRPELHFPLHGIHATHAHLISSASKTLFKHYDIVDTRCPYTCTYIYLRQSSDCVSSRVMTVRGFFLTTGRQEPRQRGM